MIKSIITVASMLMMSFAISGPCFSRNSYAPEQQALIPGQNAADRVVKIRLDGLAGPGDVFLFRFPANATDDIFAELLHREAATRFPGTIPNIVGDLRTPPIELFAYQFLASPMSFSHSPNGYGGTRIRFPNNPNLGGFYYDLAYLPYLFMHATYRGVRFTLRDSETNQSLLRVVFKGARACHLQDIAEKMHALYLDLTQKEAFGRDSRIEAMQDFLRQNAKILEYDEVTYWSTAQEEISAQIADQEWRALRAV